VRKPKKFPSEPPEEDELVRLRREHRQLTKVIRERDQQISFLAGVARREAEAVTAMREVQQVFCRTVMAVRDRIEPLALTDAAAEAWQALIDLADEWLGDGGTDVATDVPEDEGLDGCARG